MVIAYCLMGSRVNVSEEIYFGTGLTKEKDIFLSGEILKCKQ